MITQLFKMIWHKRKSNLLLIVQLFFSFLAMSLFIAVNMDQFSKYLQPLNYNYSNVWAIELGLDSIPKEQADDYLVSIKERLEFLPEIELVTYGNLIPFYSFGDIEHFTFNGIKTSVRSFKVDENYQKVLDLSLLKGRWYNENDNLTNIIPIVITKDLYETYFHDENALGKIITLGKQKARILGISEIYRDDATKNSITTGCIFQPIPADTIFRQILLKSKHTDNFLFLKNKLTKEINSNKDDKLIIKKNSPLAMIKKTSNKSDLTQLIIALLIFIFLASNIFLGVSGVFSYTISKRKGEVGLRVSTGASSIDIMLQFFSETIIITSFAIIPGIVIALQIFMVGLFKGVSIYQGLIGIGVSATFLYLLMITCALYPSIKASKIQPAKALHED